MKETSVLIAILICVEGLEEVVEEEEGGKEDEELKEWEEEEAMGRSMISTSSTDQDENDENWVLVEEKNKY